MQFKISHIKQFTKSDSLKLLNKILICIAVIAPAMTLPQIIKIFTLKDATGVSALSWGMFALLDIPWVIYAIANRNLPIFIAYVLWFTSNTTVTIGALIYG